MDRSIWQRLGEGDYSNVTMSFGDTLEGSKVDNKILLVVKECMV